MEKQKIKKYQIAAVLVLMAAVILAGAIYWVSYPVAFDPAAPDEEGLERVRQAVEELLVHNEVEVLEITSIERTLWGEEEPQNDWFIAMCKAQRTRDAGIWGTETRPAIGPVLFERGINGRYAAVEASLYDAYMPINESTVRDGSAGIFQTDIGADALTVFYSYRCPPEIASFEVTIYDHDAYYNEGKAVATTVRLPAGQESFAYVLPVSFHLYDRSYKAFDAAGKELDLREIEDPYWDTAGNSVGSVGGGNNVAGRLDLCGVILLFSVLVAWYLWKKKENV